MNPEAKIMLDYCASKGITRGRMLDLGAGNDAEGDSSVAKPFIDAGWEVVLVDAAPSCVAIQAAKYGTQSVHGPGNASSESSVIRSLGRQKQSHSIWYGADAIG